MESFVVSIHDVMPQTLAKCVEISGLLDEHGFTSPTLLVVPNCAWTEAEIDQLRRLQHDGAILAGHGWNHSAKNIRGLYHTLHSKLISRDVAEHLELDAEGIRELIRRCHRFFDEHALAVSDLYVPPAWAMGSVRRHQLSDLPFRFFESLGGVYDAERRLFMPSPMIGFEADTRFRARCCRLWNRFNMLRARSGSPVRLAIHPNDLSLRLADDLRRIIAVSESDLDYSVFAG